MIDARNQADTLISASERTLKDGGDKVPEADKKDVEAKITALKDLKDKNDLDAIKKASEELSTAIQKVGAGMYSASAEATTDKQAQGPDQNQQAGSQGPVDAEVVDEKK